MALGRALVREPKVFLMDEPLSNLDAKLRAQMRTEINKLHQKLQTTFIYVTHDQVEAMTMGTMIVVMKDGVIQQIDAPQVLYENPVNLFVAGFIGSPQMNTAPCTVEKKGSDYYVNIGTASFKIPEGKAKKLEGVDIEGKELIFGIRPENVHDEDIYLSTLTDSKVEVDVDITEAMGAETQLYIVLEGNNFIAKVNPRSTAKAGDRITVALDLEKMHLFDKETTLAII